MRLSLAVSAACLLLLASAAQAGGPQEPEQQQQQMPMAPKQLASPNQPTTIVLDQGGSNIAEWAALFSGLAALLAALEVLRRRRKHGPG